MQLLGGGGGGGGGGTPHIFHHWSQVYEYHQDAVQGQIFIFFNGVEKFLVGVSGTTERASAGVGH
jgi:hypothetical protein